MACNFIMIYVEKRPQQNFNPEAGTESSKITTSSPLNVFTVKLVDPTDCYAPVAMTKT